MKKLAIIIPLFNEEEIISKTIEEWANLKIIDDYDLIFVDDGSTDNSVDIILSYKKRFRKIVLLKKKNEGHGKALLYAYKYAISKNYEFIFQTDSDYQFRSKDFIKFWNFKNNDYQLIIGNRYKRHDPIIRVILSKILLRFLICLFFRKIILDSNIPYRLIEINYLKYFMEKVPHNSSIPNIFMSILSNKTYSFNIDHYSRNHGEISWDYIKLFKFGKNLIKEIINFKKIIKNL